MIKIRLFVIILGIISMKHSFTGSTLKISFYPFQQSNLSKSQRIQRIIYFFVTFSRVDYFSFFFHEYIHGYSYLLTGQLTQMCHCGSIILLSASKMFLTGSKVVQNELFFLYRKKFNTYICIYPCIYT